MDLNGIWASVNFPQDHRLLQVRLLGVLRPALGKACVRAFNWYFDEWVITAPERFVPIGITFLMIRRQRHRDPPQRRSGLCAVSLPEQPQG
jgi:hypothetical protein